jgi:CHAT domain-containing protein
MLQPDVLAAFAVEDLEEMVAQAAATPGACAPEVFAFLRARAAEPPPTGSSFPTWWWSRSLQLRARVLEVLASDGADAATEFARSVVLEAAHEMLKRASWVDKLDALERMGYILLNPLAGRLLCEYAALADQRDQPQAAIELRQHADLLARIADSGTVDDIVAAFESGEDAHAPRRLLTAADALARELTRAAPTDLAAVASAATELDAALRESSALPGLHLRILRQAVDGLRSLPPDPAIVDAAVALTRTARAQTHPDLASVRAWELRWAAVLAARGDADALKEALAVFDRLALDGLPDDLIPYRARVLRALIAAVDVRGVDGAVARDLDLLIGYRERLLDDPSLEDADRVENLIELASAYNDRARSNHSGSDLDTAVEHAEAAMKLARRAAPVHEQRAAAMLGRLLLVRAQRTDRGDDIQRAVDQLKRALDLTDREDAATRARAHNDLGSALMKQAQLGVVPAWGRTTDDIERDLIEQALTHYRTAVSIPTGDPHADAAHRANLALGLHGLWRLADDPALLSDAIAHVGAALEIADPDDPYRPRWTAKRAELLLLRGSRDDAAEAEAVIDGLVAPEPQDAVGLAHLAAEAAAVRAAGSADSGDRIDTLFRRALDAAGPPAARLRVAVRWAEWAAAAGRPSVAIEAYTRVPALLRQLAGAQSAHDDLLRVAGNVSGVADEAGHRLAIAGRVPEAVAALDAGRALTLRRRLGRVALEPAHRDAESLERAAAVGHPVVFFAVTRDGGSALVVDGAREMAVTLPQLSSATLLDASRPYLVGLRRGTARLRAVETMCATLWDLAIGPVVAAIGHPEAMTLVPSSMLVMLPLHAACQRDGERRRYLLDVTTVSVAPNTDAIQRGVAAPLRPRPRSTLLVAEPRPSTAPALPGADAECAVVRRLLKPNECIGQAATKENVLAQISSHELLHFACHGVASPADPLASAVLLAGDERLEARDLAERELSARLVVLAACETAFPGLLIPEEAIGLPTSLLASGAASVIASLWPVADWSTAELMCRFHLALDAGLEPAAALRAAQRAVRDTTVAEKRALLREQTGVAVDPWPLGLPQAQPFARPYYWAGFTFTGGFSTRQTGTTSGSALRTLSA